MPGDVSSQLERRRQAVAERWNLRDQAVVIGAGEPVPIPGRGDRTYPFRAHSEYFYLTDRERPGGVLAYDPDEGWVDFVRPVSREELLWEGAPPDGQAGVPLDELGVWLARRNGRSVANLGASVPGVESGSDPTAELRRALNHVRRQKDPIELERMRAAERATAAGFAAIVPLVTAGRTERDIQIELEAEFFRAGADSLAFDTIVAGGANSGVLHFPPTARPLGDGELVLIDAGGEVRGYASDVTRTYPVSGSFTPEQAALHDLVDRAGQAATSRCAAGIEFRELHRTAALLIAEGLVDFGLLRGRPESLVQSGAVTVFFPHGVGHMVGLGVRDAGEVLPGREPEPGLPGLRADLPLLAGHVVTIEPGVYFVPALLADP
ncbi:MAG TPA: aminopeptidase P N-terminal domain-containing protein, partial [Solirubrobacteraceae bacterium]|nr:aminopeptidase P N-terminal domain-containing protein [Solirubrobacteraceae bacterium]